MNNLNPLVTGILYLVCMANILISKKEGIIKEISYERRAYESVDDWSHSWVISQKINGKQNSGTNGLKKMKICE